MTTMSKEEKRMMLFDMQEHPEKYTDDQVERLLADDVVLVPESEEGYLMRSVRNRCLNLIAHKSVKERVAKLLLDDSDVILSEETDERLDRLMLLIEDLEPPIRQLIFRLRYLQEKSYQEVADEVGVSKVTVFNHLSKAMDWIKKQFK